MSAPFVTQELNAWFWCEHCERYQLESSMVGDDEPICQSCYEDRLDRYKDAFDEQAGHPLQAVDALVRGWRK